MTRISNVTVEKAAKASLQTFCDNGLSVFSPDEGDQDDVDRGRWITVVSAMRAAIEAVADDLVTAEREAAAKAADRCAYGWSITPPKAQKLRLDSEVAVETAEAIAAAIRARTTKEQI